jgi:hypothetical protein
MKAAYVVLQGCRCEPMAAATEAAAVAASAPPAAVAVVGQHLCAKPAAGLLLMAQLQGCICVSAL